MDKKLEELIAIGASITAHCQPCLKYHTEEALKFGASLEEISAAIEVGKTVGKGAFKAMEEFAREYFENLEGSTSCSESSGACCCSSSGCCQ